jgi:geranylgeranyl diphosphate synthase type I
MKDFSCSLESALRAFLAERRPEAVAIDDRLGTLIDELECAVLSGGKRLRPVLLAWGYRAGGREVDGAAVRAAAALELLHTFALIQDDVMDQSTTRRGRPASHVVLAAAAEIAPERFGPSGAMLLGDLALIWADELLGACGVPPERLARGLEVYNSLRTEVTMGQYLDVLAAHSHRVTEEQALTVNRYKTASYTVQRPIQLGMALAGAPAELVRSVSDYAIPAGVAFQLRDDVLGAFGDPEVTGKPSGQDLLERKPTWLWARTLRLCPEVERTTGVAALRDLMVRSGALADAEAKIATLAGEARAAAERLAVDQSLVCELLDLTDRLISRTS